MRKKITLKALSYLLSASLCVGSLSIGGSYKKAYANESSDEDTSDSKSYSLTKNEIYVVKTDKGQIRYCCQDSKDLSGSKGNTASEDENGYYIISSDKDFGIYKSIVEDNAVKQVYGDSEMAYNKRGEVYVDTGNNIQIKNAEKYLGSKIKLTSGYKLQDEAYEDNVIVDGDDTKPYFTWDDHNIYIYANGNSIVTKDSSEEIQEDEEDEYMMSVYRFVDVYWDRNGNGKYDEGTDEILKSEDGSEDCHIVRDWQLNYTGPDEIEGEEVDSSGWDRFPGHMDGDKITTGNGDEDIDLGEDEDGDDEDKTSYKYKVCDKCQLVIFGGGKGVDIKGTTSTITIDSSFINKIYTGGNAADCGNVTLKVNDTCYNDLCENRYKTYVYGAGKNYGENEESSFYYNKYTSYPNYIMYRDSFTDPVVHVFNEKNDDLYIDDSDWDDGDDGDGDDWDDGDDEDGDDENSDSEDADVYSSREADDSEDSGDGDDGDNEDDNTVKDHASFWSGVDIYTTQKDIPVNTKVADGKTSLDPDYDFSVTLTYYDKQKKEFKVYNVKNDDKEYIYVSPARYVVDIIYAGKTILGKNIVLSSSADKITDDAVKLEFVEKENEETTINCYVGYSDKYSMCKNKYMFIDGKYSGHSTQDQGGIEIVYYGVRYHSEDCATVTDYAEDACLFDSNASTSSDGSNSFGDEDDMYDDNVTEKKISYILKSGDIFSKENYTFDSWNSREDGKGISYLADDTVQIDFAETDCIDLYAQWTQKKEIKKEMLSYRFDDLKYDGKEKKIEVPKAKAGCKLGNITLNFYTDEDYTNRVNEIKNAGTYYVAADIAESEEYASALKLKLGSFNVTAESTEPEETKAPTVEETKAPTVEETKAPTSEETKAPTVEETKAPTVEETKAPTVEETKAPTVEETKAPTVEETKAPTVEETKTPAVEETKTPAVEETKAPTVEETKTPAVEETKVPTVEETKTPTVEETETPTVKPTATPKVIKKGSTFTYKKTVYKIISIKGKTAEAALVRCDNKNTKSYVIENTFKYNGRKCKIVNINSSAFKKCTKLKSIKIKSTYIKKVGRNAFKGINKKAVITVPKKLYKKYKKLINKKTGFVKTMKLKK